jgi:hypothetical protein
MNMWWQDHRGGSSPCLLVSVGGETRAASADSRVSRVRLNRQVGVVLHSPEVGEVVLARVRFHSLTTSSPGSRRVNNDAGGFVWRKKRLKEFEYGD